MASDRMVGYWKASLAPIRASPQDPRERASITHFWKPVRWGMVNP